MSTDELVIKRVNEGKCPICKQTFKDTDDIHFEYYGGSQQPIHKHHVNFTKEVEEKVEEEIKEEVL